MFTWKKKGKVFTPQAVEGRSWLKEFAQAPGTLILDDFMRLCSPWSWGGDVNSQYVSYSEMQSCPHASDCNWRCYLLSNGNECGRHSFNLTEIKA